MFTTSWLGGPSEPCSEVQDARKGVRFKSFPPVLFLQLKRFEFDYDRGITVKVCKLPALRELQLALTAHSLAKCQLALSSAACQLR